MEIKGKTKLVMITYDVNTGRMRRGSAAFGQLAKLCVAARPREQNSVFECSLDAARSFGGLKAELTKLIDSQKDSLRCFYNLGNVISFKKLEHIALRSGYQPDDVLML